MPRKPSAMKRTGKAVAKKKNGYAKATRAASKLGGQSGKAVSAIQKRRAATKRALKST
jgi:hypothetical protein